MKRKTSLTLVTSRSNPELLRNSSRSALDHKKQLSPRNDPFINLTRNGSSRLLPVCPPGLRIPVSEKTSDLKPRDIFQFPKKHLLPPILPRKGAQTCHRSIIQFPLSKPTKNMKRLNTPCFSPSISESSESGSTMLTIDDLPSPVKGTHMSSDVAFLKITDMTK